ncbi:hypothetical protein QBC38DRAFT_254642 [Podospora fimiseda]|uniref:Uncharacterized protein n=1 Tax=Podospora fimiseda TaxID=252190 RepID=A0AAN7BLV5_9PEZI|nr:hypothetical protein QBC38DRAFT_254642 [Podospora fimiseda]
MALRTDSVSMLSDENDERTQHSNLSGGYQRPRYIICVDYGTTFTGVAWILTQPRERPKVSDIKVVKNWTQGSDIRPKVPSEITYSANSGSNWGFNIGKEAYILRWTKLQLPVPGRLDALISMRRALQEADKLDLARNGQERRRADLPRHLIKTTPQIVTDYLTEVFKQARADIEREKDAKTLEQFPIDLVITHPADWDSRGRGLTFRAAMTAFRAAFSGIHVRTGTLRLATEPEACAQYTLQAARAQNMITTHQLREGECFMVVDAGGGTVDLVSYHIDKLTPEFKISKITDVSGAACGATRIDHYFLYTYLPRTLGPENYRRLLDLGGLRDRHGSSNHTVLKVGEEELLEKFQQRKFQFKGRTETGAACPDMVIDIPQRLRLANDRNPKIRNGQLLISCADMEEMFKECVVGIRKLIDAQLLKIDNESRNGRTLLVRTIFFSGGFSNNEYLFNCVRKLANQWQSELVRAGDPWTAVASGGVLLGLGLECPVPPPVVPSPFNLGVEVSTKFASYDHTDDQLYKDAIDGVDRAHNHIEWFVHKGDLIEDQPTTKTVNLVRKFSIGGSKTGRVTIIQSSADDPKRFSPADVSRREVCLDFDLQRLPSDPRDRLPEFKLAIEAVPGDRTTKPHDRLQMQLDVLVTQKFVDVALICAKTGRSLAEVQRIPFSDSGWD